MNEDFFVNTPNHANIMVNECSFNNPRVFVGTKLIDGLTLISITKDDTLVLEKLIVDDCLYESKDFINNHCLVEHLGTKSVFIDGTITSFSSTLVIDEKTTKQVITLNIKPT